MQENTNGRLLQGKGLQIQINNKTIIETPLTATGRTYTISKCDFNKINEKFMYKE